LAPFRGRNGAESTENGAVQIWKSTTGQPIWQAFAGLRCLVTTAQLVDPIVNNS
jgi:hypothetical protein